MQLLAQVGKMEKGETGLGSTRTVCPADFRLGLRRAAVGPFTPREGQLHAGADLMETQKRAKPCFHRTHIK